MSVPADQRKPAILVHHLDVEFLGFVEFRTRPGSRHDDVGLFRHRTRHFCAQALSAMALASSRVICSSAPVKTTVLPATGESDSVASAGSTWTWASNASSISSLCCSLKNSTIASATTEPIPPMDVSPRELRIEDRPRLSLPRAGPRSSKMACKKLCRRVAHMRDAERIDEPVHRDLASGLDRGKQVLDAQSRPILRGFPAASGCAHFLLPSVKISCGRWTMPSA